MEEGAQGGKSNAERRQELIQIALEQYIAKGYEGTSIRSIAKAAGGGTGLFYHYFDSKNEIYEAALDLYNKKYLKAVEVIMKNPALAFDKKLDLLLGEVNRTIPPYRNMHTAHANPDVMTVLLMRTLNRMVPLLQPVLIRHLEERGARVPEADYPLITRFLLYGISSVIHAPEQRDLEAKLKAARLYFDVCLEGLLRRYRE